MQDDIDKKDYTGRLHQLISISVNYASISPLHSFNKVIIIFHSSWDKDNLLLRGCQKHIGKIFETSSNPPS